MIRSVCQLLLTEGQCLYIVGSFLFFVFLPSQDLILHGDTSIVVTSLVGEVPAL